MQKMIFVLIPNSLAVLFQKISLLLLKSPNLDLKVFQSFNVANGMIRKDNEKN